MSLPSDAATRAEMNALVENFERSIVFGNKPDIQNQILSIIERPFINDDKNNDILSKIYHRFYINSDIPVALPVFAFLSIISAWCVKNGVMYREPLEVNDKHPDTWMMLLSPSGVSKTTSMAWISQLVPKKFDGEPVIEPNFKKPNGPAAFVENLCALPDGKGFWVQDEASQLIALIEQIGHPMSEIKEMMLEMKDHKKIRRQSKGSVMESSPIVMTQLFINTIDSMAKKLSDDSFHDGLTRRYTIGVVTKDDRDFTDFPNYDVAKICDETLLMAMVDVFNQDIRDKKYSFNTKAVVLFNRMFKTFWKKQYEAFMTGSETTYKTYCREAYKYAIFHHIIHAKSGTVIDEISMEWALKVVLFFLNSLQYFIEFRATRGKTALNYPIQENKIEKAMTFIRQNESKKGFGVRAFCRKFNIKRLMPWPCWIAFG